VLTLPLARGAEALALLVFIGGLSAATGMVIVETIALSTMVCNDLVMPCCLLRSAWLDAKAAGSVRPADRHPARRHRPDPAPRLHLFPGCRRSLCAGRHRPDFLRRRRPVRAGHVSAACTGNRVRGPGPSAGLLGRFRVWLYTLLLPSFAKSGWIGSGFVEQGLFGIGLLKAQALFGLSGLDEISHCLWWSLLANIGCYIAVSLNSKPDAVEASQAERFVDVFRHAGRDADARLWRGNASVDEAWSDCSSVFSGHGPCPSAIGNLCPGAGCG
jgi:hypothetical protein